MDRRPLPVIDAGRTEFGFHRTACSCPACILYCVHMPGYLIPHDLERLLAQLAPGEDSFAWAEAHLRASPGALVMSEGHDYRIPTLVPARGGDGACSFLTRESRCSIHAVAPYGCAFFDCVQTAE
jgi:hypothetical protein